LNWDELVIIKNDYINNIDKIEVAAQYVAQRLERLKQVHTIRWRVKEPDHLLAKIIRRKAQEPSLVINPHNYQTIITDLAGVRALHLFKEDWQKIHSFIVNTWELIEKATANVCVGDHVEFIKKFKQKGCRIYQHPFGYRSVHYLVKFDYSKKESIPVEIQVRTVLEEAWSEMDHRIRYPYSGDAPALSPYLLLLNRLLGSADEMGSFIKLLKKEIDSNYQFQQYKPAEGRNLIKGLGNTVEALQLEGRAKALLEERVSSLEGYLSAVRAILTNSQGENSCTADVSRFPRTPPIEVNKIDLKQ